MRPGKAWLALVGWLIVVSPCPALADWMEEIERIRDLAYEMADRHGAIPAAARRMPDAGTGTPVGVPGGPVRWTERRRDLDAVIRAASHRYALNPKFVRAVIQVESNFNPRAISPKGARGLMQLMPATAVQLGVTDPHDPEENISAGVRFLAALLEEFGDVGRALIAYNAGPGVVREARSIPRESLHYQVAVLTAYRRMQPTQGH